LEEFFQIYTPAKIFASNLNAVLPEVTRSVCLLIKKAILCFAEGPYLPTQHTYSRGTVIINDNWKENSSKLRKQSVISPEI
jgi:hypothetical protein